MIHTIPLIEYKIPIRCNIYQVQAMTMAINAEVERIILGSGTVDASQLLELEVLQQLNRYFDRRFRNMYNSQRFTSRAKATTISLPLQKWMLLHQALIYDCADFDFDDLMDKIDQALQQYSHLVRLGRKERIEQLKRLLKLAGSGQTHE